MLEALKEGQKTSEVGLLFKKQPTSLSIVTFVGPGSGHFVYQCIGDKVRFVG